MTTTYDVVLLTDFTNTVLTAKPIGAYKLASSLRFSGYSCLVVDYLSHWPIQDMMTLLERAVGANTLFVGLSTTFLQTVNAVTDTEFYSYNPEVSIFPQGKHYEEQVIAKLKLLNRDCKIVLGGHKIGPMCKNKNVDIIVRGLAELSVVNIANSLKQKISIPDSYKNLYGTIVVEKNQEKEYDFANSPMVWTDTDVLNYRVLPLEPARGCIFNCRFCSFPQRGKKTLDYVINEELLYEELKSNYEKYSITTYQLLDDTFNDSDYKLDMFLGVVKQLPFQPVFWAYNRLDLLAVKPERIQKMFDIGLRATSFGIETLKKKTGLVVGKGFDAKRLIETVRVIRKRYGNELLMHGLFIIGLPHESLKQVQQTFDLIHSQEFPLHSAFFETLFIMKPNAIWLQSDFDKNWQSYGYKDLGNDPKELHINWCNSFMTRSQAEEKKQELFKILQNDSKFHIPGQTAWSLMNYKNFALSRVQNLKNSEIDWSEVSQAKIDFFTEYRQQLFSKLYSVVSVV